VSVTGTWMQVLGVDWFVLQETGSATHMGLTVMLPALPVLLLGPYGGALADRLPPRRLLLLTQAAHVALVVALTLVMLRSVRCRNRCWPDHQPPGGASRWTTLVAVNSSSSSGP
jgi:nitrate/nitrite transporter NarK